IRLLTPPSFSLMFVTCTARTFTCEDSASTADRRRKISAWMASAAVALSCTSRSLAHDSVIDPRARQRPPSASRPRTQPLVGDPRPPFLRRPSRPHPVHEQAHLHHPPPPGAPAFDLPPVQARRPVRVHAQVDRHLVELVVDAAGKRALVPGSPALVQLAERTRHRRDQPGGDAGPPSPVDYPGAFARCGGPDT